MKRNVSCFLTNDIQGYIRSIGIGKIPMTISLACNLYVIANSYVCCSVEVPKIYSHITFSRIPFISIQEHLFFPIYV